jgi:CRP-like cAMP-binding protein
MSNVRPGSSFWGLLGDTERAVLTTQARPRVFTSGATLCSEGEPSTHVFIVLTGWVKIVTANPEGRESLQALRGQGDVVGEIAEITGYRIATARAIGTVRSLIIRAESFAGFLDTYSAAGRAYRRAMTERQAVAYESQRTRALTTGAQRLARLLLGLAEQQGAGTSDAVRIVIPLSQEELASLIGASRATVTRALARWRSQGLVRTQHQHITVIDQAALLRIGGQA